MQPQKQQNNLAFFPRQTIQHHSNPGLAPTTDAKEAEADEFYEDLQHLLQLTAIKGILSITGDCNENVESQEILE